MGVSVIIGGVLGGAIYTGAVSNPVETPSASVEDIGDWGDVTDDKIELIHTLNVQNPNPVDAELSSNTALSIRVQLNDVRLGSIRKSGLDIQQGSNSVKITSELQQDRIAEFWSRFINQDETIHAQISADLEMDIGPGFSVSAPSIEVSALTEEQPISEALKSVGDEIEGRYGEDVDTNNLPEKYRPSSGFDAGPSRTVSAEYTIQNVEFEWGDVSPDKTELLVNIRVKNTGDTLLPGAPDGIATNILLNDIDVFNAQSETIALRNIDGDSVIRRGETESYTLVATANNQNIEKWFTSYAERKEKSTARVEFQLLFSFGDSTISVPKGGALAYDCSFQTGIFVDSQSTSTSCGDRGTIEIGSREIEQSTLEGSNERDGSDGNQDNDESDTSTETDGSDTETEADSGTGPTAVADADKRSGQAPLKIEFDAKESAASGGEISRYEWRFDRGASPGRGETITRVFEREGEYEVELTVIDNEGRSDTDTVIIDVDPRRDR